MSLYSVNSQLAKYDNGKGWGRRIFGDHEAIKELKSYRDDKTLNLEKKYEQITSLLLRYKFKDNDRKLTFDIFTKLKQSFAQYYYNEAEKLWKERQYNWYGASFDFKNNCIKYYRTVTYLTKIPNVVDKNGCETYGELGKLANARLVTSFEEEHRCANAIKQQAANYKKTYTYVSRIDYMLNQLPHPRYTIQYDKRVLVSYEYFESNYNNKLRLCNDKIKEYNDKATSINLLINGKTNTNNNEGRIFSERNDLKVIETDLNDLKYDLDVFVSKFKVSCDERY